MTERMDVPYGTANGRDLKLDIYAPDEGDSLRTAVLMFHGGGWRRGDRKNIAPRAHALQAERLTAFAVEYRLLGESPWPAPVHDVKAAIRWVRANASELGIEPDRIVLQGHSAGAHISLLAAGTAGLPEWEGEGGNPHIDSSVAAVAAFYPPTAFHPGEVREPGSLPVSRLLDGVDDLESARKVSPLTYVSAGFPPVFFVHGGADRVVPTSASITMYDALRAAGTETDLHIFAGQNHEFDAVDSFRGVVAREVSLFFQRFVSRKEEIAQQVLDQSMFARRAAEEAAAGGRP